MDLVGREAPVGVHGHKQARRRVQLPTINSAEEGWETEFESMKISANFLRGVFGSELSLQSHVMWTKPERFLTYNIAGISGTQTPSIAQDRSLEAGCETKNQAKCKFDMKEFSD